MPVFDAKLEDLLPKPGRRVRDGVSNAQLVLITSQEIDELCEQDNITQARRQMDGVLNDLRRGFRVLSDLVHLHRSSYAIGSPVVYLGYETTSLYSTLDR